MSNIRKFPGADDESPVERIDSRFKRRKQTRLMKVLLAVVIIAVIVAAFCIYEKEKVYSGYEVVSSIIRTDSANTAVTDFDGTIMTYSKDGAGAMDAEGNLLWNQTFDMQYPLMSKCGNTVAFADYGGSSIYIQTSSGESSTVATNMPVRKISVASGGYVAAVLEDTDVTWIYLYNMNGDEIAYFRTTMEKSGYPVDISISPNGEMVAVSYYFLDVNDIHTSVAFYNFGEVGQNKIDNWVSGYNYSDSLVPLVRFLDNETAFSLSSDRLSVYSGAHIPVSIKDNFLTSDVLSVYYADNAIAVIFANSSIDDQYRMAVYDTKGEILFEHEFDFDYTGVAFGDDRVVLYGDSNLDIFTFSGKVKYEGNYTEPVMMVVPTNSDKRFVILTEKNIDTIELK